MSDICDITEVGFDAEVSEFATIGQVADVGGSLTNILTFKLTELVDLGAATSNAYTELHRQLVQVGANATVSYTQTMTGGDFVNVTARGAVLFKHKLGDLAAVSAAGDVLVFQPPIRDIARVGASAVAAVLAGTRIRNVVSVSAAGLVWIDTPIKQFVSVSANAAVLAIQARWTRDLADVAAVGAGTLVSEIARVHELVSVHGAGAVIAYQHLDAYELIVVDACVEADVMPDSDVALGWSAASRSFGMSRHRYPRDINSIAPFGDCFLMAGHGGLYLLNDNTGADDITKGATVDASLRMPMVDFGESALKRGIALYISYRSTDSVGVDVGETQTGTERTWSYLSPVLTNIDFRPIRVPIGKGIRSRFLRFTLRNTQGGALTVASAEADHLSTTRRT